MGERFRCCSPVDDEEDDGGERLDDVGGDSPDVSRCGVVMGNVFHDVSDSVSSVGDGEGDDCGGHPVVSESSVGTSDTEDPYSDVCPSDFPLEH